jgi:S1-C subfamily serine protease
MTRRSVAMIVSAFVSLFIIFGTTVTSAFVSHHHQQHSAALLAVAVSIDELEKDLTPAERSITSVVRNCGPAVAFVTSVLPDPTASSTAAQTRRGRRRQSTNAKPNDEEDSGSRNGNNLPVPGTSLGSGSGFVVGSDGYVATNYHVIERAYTIRTNAERVESMIDQLAGNLTQQLPSSFTIDAVNATKTFLTSSFLKLLGATDTRTMEDVLPAVYVRINSSTKYLKCRIVDVKPDIDLAVLKVIQDDSSSSNNKNNTSIDPQQDSSSSRSEQTIFDVVPFGSSSSMLVGQTVVAIGNPFSLEKTVTTGVVSAVNREFRAGTARTPANTPIRNVIQSTYNFVDTDKVNRANLINV